MNNNYQWFFAKNEKQEGPFDYDNIGQKFNSGEITMDTQMWRQGLGSWIFAREIPEIAEFFSTLSVVKVWSVIANKSVSKEPAGPFSANEIDSFFESGNFNDDSLFWKKGMDGWMSLYDAPELSVVSSKVRERAAASVQSSQSPPELPPDIKNQDAPPVFIDNGPPPLIVGSSDLSVISESQDKVDLPASFPDVFGPHDKLAGFLRVMFYASPREFEVGVFISELGRGYDMGDSIKIDLSIEKIRLLILNEVKNLGAPSHPYMTEENIKGSIAELIAFTNNQSVKDRIATFDPFYALGQEGSPSATASRVRSMLRAATESSFYPSY